MIRSVENRLARRYIRQDAVVAFFSLHGNWEAARAYCDASRRTVIEDVSDIIHSGLVKGELLARFYACLIAERYIRRFGVEPTAERRAA